MLGGDLFRDPVSWADWQSRVSRAVLDRVNTAWQPICLSVVNHDRDATTATAAAAVAAVLPLPLRHIISIDKPTSRCNQTMR